jgi:acyl dehydratase
MTDTWKINGVRLSGRMIEIMTAEVNEGRWHRFVKQGDLVTVESVLPDNTRIVETEVKAT